MEDVRPSPLSWYDTWLDHSGLAPGPRLPTRRVLVVEDDPSLYPLVRRSLREASQGSYELEIEFAKDLERGFERFLMASSYRDSHFDLVLCDIYLPQNFTGVELWRMCRQYFPWQPFIFMSSMEEGDYQKHFNLGEKAPQYIKKPFHKEEMALLTDSLLMGL